MNVLNRLTLRYLRLNRTRTLVTVIGVILSAAMFSAVTTFAVSLQQGLIRSSIALYGDWEGSLDNIPYTTAEKAAQDEEIASSYLIRHEGYALLEGCQNADKPYLAVEALDSTALTSLPIHLTEGRLPESEDEIVISQHISENGGVYFHVGDTLTLQVGRRLTEDGYTFWQNTPYDPDALEQLDSTQTRTYTVVGVMERPSFEPYSAPGYTVVTRLPDGSASGDDTVSLYLHLEHPRRIFTSLPQLAETYGCSDSSVSYNKNVLRMQGIGSDNFMNTYLSLAAILIALIVIGSVSLIYNAFAISVSERSRQFGMLSGVGATSRQIRRTVFFEAFVVGALGIPLGIGAGIGGIGITLYCLRDSLSHTGLLNQGESLELAVSFPSVLLAALLCLITILLSAWTPARRAGRQSAIDAIRQTDDVHIRPRQVKTSPISRRLFGFEGELALKNFRRNRRRYRTTVLSLAVSIILFLSASSFTLYLTKSTQVAIEETPFDLLVGVADEETADRLLPQLSALPGVNWATYSRAESFSCEVPASYVEEYLTEEQESDDGTRYCYLPVDEKGNVNLYDVTLYAVDDGEMVRYLTELGLDPDQYTDPEHPRAVVLDHQRYQQDGRYVDAHVFRTKPDQLTLVSNAYHEEDSPPAFLVLYTPCYADTAPRGMNPSTLGISGIQVVVSRSVFQSLWTGTNSSGSLSVYISSSTPEDTGTAIEDLMARQRETNYSVYNVAEQEQTQKSLILVINVFSYGFITLISLITVANVFNTISTNIHLRRREFATLQSVGMTSGAFRKMMNFECLFYGFKALLYGLPLSACTTVLIYWAVSNGVSMDFIVPWSSVLFCVACVFLIVFVSMLYSMTKIRRENLVDVLKSETN